jgi:hypothetical protein
MRIHLLSNVNESGRDRGDSWLGINHAFTPSRSHDATAPQAGGAKLIYTSATFKIRHNDHSDKGRC